MYEFVLHSESQGRFTEKDKYYIISHIWNLKSNTNESVRNRLTDIENKLMVTKGERTGEG